MTIHDTIAQIEALEAKATSTEWKAENLDDEPYGRITVYKKWNAEQWANARLIIALRNAAPDIIAYIRELERERDDMRMIVNDVKRHADPCDSGAGKFIKDRINDFERMIAAAREAGK